MKPWYSSMFIACVNLALKKRGGRGEGVRGIVDAMESITIFFVTSRISRG
jgi:hypothetical protein